MYLVIDIEATCYRTGEAPKNFVSEIIEIGCVLLDANYKQIDQFRYYVRPNDDRISDFCTELTGITHSMLAGGCSLKEIIKLLKDRVRLNDLEIKDLIFCSWGEYDKNQFKRECAAKDIDYPFGETHVNIKREYATAHKIAGCGVSKALDISNRVFQGNPHRALDDAINIAILFRETRCLR